MPKKEACRQGVATKGPQTLEYALSLGILLLLEVSQNRCLILSERQVSMKFEEKKQIVHLESEGVLSDLGELLRLVLWSGVYSFFQVLRVFRDKLCPTVHWSPTAQFAA